MELRALRRQRRSIFWGKVLPFVPYIFQSGLAVVLLLSMIAFSAWYTAFLNNIPPNLPIRWIMLVVLGPLAVYSSFRTYLAQADLIFLLPQESRMKEYLNPAIRSGIMYKLIGLLLILLLIWPLYIRSEGHPQPFWLLLTALILLKLLSAYGTWQEFRMVTARSRAGYRLLRYCFILLMLAAWLWQPAWKSAVFMLMLSLNYYLALRFPLKHNVPWENLIAAEKAGSAKVMRFLSWFVDVPLEGQRVIRRSWLSSAGNRISWNSASAYRYLLIKTFIRSELLGILLRLLPLGMLLSYWNGGSWFGVGIYLFFILLAGMQLTMLRHVHHDSPAASYYPLPQGARRGAVIYLSSVLLLSISILLWVPLGISAIVRGELTQAAVSLASGMGLTLIMRSTWVRRWKDDEED